MSLISEKHREGVGCSIYFIVRLFIVNNLQMLEYNIKSYQQVG